MKNKIFISVGLLLTILLIGLGYWFFFMEKENGGLQVVDDNNSFILGNNNGANTFIPFQQDEEEIPTQAPIEQFTQISNEPIASFTLREEGVGTSTSPLVRYITRGNGHIFDYNLDTGERTRVSNTTISGVSNADWSENGEQVFIQHFSVDTENLLTSFIDLEDREATSTARDVIALASHIDNIATHNNTFVWVRHIGNESVIETGTIGTFSPTEIYRSGFSEWDVSFVNDETILLSTKPSGHSKGYAYTLSTQTKRLTPILQNIDGLTLYTNATGNGILYSQASNTSISLFFKELDSSTILPQIIKTLPEKCVFSNEFTLWCGVPQNIPPRTYPDDWYQSEFTFTDSIQKIDLQTRTEKVVYNPYSGRGLSIDIIKPHITKNDRYFIGIDKDTQTLWRLKI